MPDNASGNPQGADPGTRRLGTEGNDSITVVIDATSGDGDDQGRVNVGLESNLDADSTDHDSLSVDFGDMAGNAGHDELPAGNADEHELSFRATAEDFGELDIDLSPWAPLLGTLDSTEPEESPGDRPFTPIEGVERAHALELRAESMLQYSERGAVRTGELDRTEVGVSDDNRDVVAGLDEVEIDGMLEEHTGHGLVHVADDVEMNVGGSLRMHAHLEDNIIMAGVMRDEFAGGTFVTAAMSDDMAAGLGLRCTAPLDLWVHGLVGMEERPGTCAADGILLELAGTLYEREYGPSAHVALVARHSGTVVTTMKTGFRPLMKTAIGVRNLIPGGGGGGGQASASPPAAPPAPGGGEAAGAATLTAAESGGALGRGVAGSDDTDEIVSVVRTVESASDTAEVEDLQHPASTADNLDDLARVDVEGTGYQQVADIYEQPIPLAPEQAAAEPSPGAGSTAAGSGGRQPPPLDHTAPGTEAYDFRNAYGTLHDRNQFYRQELNLRGNLYLREYLANIDAKAIKLFEGLGGAVDGVAIDNYGLRTSSVYAALETMAEQAEMADDVERLADIRAAMDQLEALVQSTLTDVAAHTDDFAGVAIGSQRGPIDPNIDVDKLRSWLEEQKLAAQQAMFDAQTPNEARQLWSWTSDYYDQLLKALDAGINPLAESSDQVAFIQAAKVNPYYAQFADEIAAAARPDAGEWVLIPPRAPDQDQLDLFLELHDGFMETVSDPEFFRSAEEMGTDTFTPAVHNPIDPGPDLPGPDSMRSLADGVDEPDVTPVPGGDVPSPPPPDHPVADPPPDSGSAAPGSAAREPTALYPVESGAEGYKFQDAYGSLDNRNQFYRGEFNFRGNFFLREYLRDIDTKAFELFDGLGGSAAALEGDSFGYRTSSIHRTLEQMADEAEAIGDVSRAAEFRAAMAEIEAMVDSTLAQVAVRTDEFSGAALGSQRAPIDPNIDTGKLRRWLQEQAQQANEMLEAAETDKAQQLATWEWGYYLLLTRSLDEGVNPLATSNEQIAVMRINKVDPYYAQAPAQFADEIAAAINAGEEFAIPRPRVEDEVDLYAKLQELLIATLSNPEFHRSAEEMGADAFTVAIRSRVEAGRDFLGPDSLRLLAGGEIPPPLPAADFADSAGYVDEVRDRSFSRSALAASEETLQRQAAGLAEGGASVRSRAPDPGSGVPEPSLGSRRTPPCDAPAPHVDERTGRWVVERPAEPNVSLAPAHGANTHTRGNGVSSQASDVSWESGVQASGDSEVGSEVGPGAGNAGDADTSDLFRAASEPEDVDPEDVDEVRHAPAADDDGSSGSRIARSIGAGGEDGNPTGTVSGPVDYTTTPGRGDRIGPGPSGTTSPITSGTPDPVSTGTPRNAPGTDATPGGASATDADAGAAGTRSDLYNEPVSFEGRSLEGAPRSGDPKELAQSLDGAEVPIEDLPPVEPDAAGSARKSILGNSDGSSVSNSYRDVHDMVIQWRRERAEINMNQFNRGTDTAETVGTRGRNRGVAMREANARWSEFAATQRTSSTSFSNDSSQLLYHIEYEATEYSRSRRRFVDRYRGADPPNTIDRSHAAHYIPRPRGWEPAHETGFGRLSQGWNQFPFSHRERILNTLSKGEALSPDQIAALESGLEGYRAGEGGLSSSQYRAMVDMISDLGDQYRRARWHMHGWRGQRLLQLIEMLDYATVAV